MWDLRVCRLRIYDKYSEYIYINYIVIIVIIHINS